MMRRRNIETLGILVLAAGSSSRLGRPKQLLPFRGTTLLGHAAATALSAGAETTWIVLGAHAEALTEEIAGMPVEIVFNGEYGEGMASSLRTGLEHMLTAHPWLGGILVMICDQPYVDAGHLRGLLEKQRVTGAALVASAYENRKGVPAVFHRDLFGELLRIKGDTGARYVIEKCEEAESVPFPAGKIDIDTADEYEALISAPDQERRRIRADKIREP